MAEIKTRKTGEDPRAFIDIDMSVLRELTTRSIADLKRNYLKSDVLST